MTDQSMITKTRHLCSTVSPIST